MSVGLLPSWLAAMIFVGWVESSKTHRECDLIMP
jgi:hypothetical protein